MSKTRSILRVLQVIVSMLCVVCAILLVCLNFRSYVTCDVYTAWPTRAQPCGVMAMQGRLYLFGRLGSSSAKWRFRSYPVEEALFNQGLLMALGRETFRVAGNSRLIVVPYLLLAAIVASLGIAPWITLARRFNLRAIAFAVTLFAMALAILRNVVIQ